MKKPKLRIVGFIFKGDNVLLLKKKALFDKSNFEWGLAGGRLEKFETFSQCLKREVFEETNIKIKNLKFIDITNDIYKDINRHYITIFYKAEYLSGNIKNKEPKKCKEIKWIAKEDFPKNVFMPINNLLKKYSLDQIYKK